MAIDIDARVVRDPADPEMRKVLGKLQGNILQGHHRKFTRHLFLTFSGGEEPDQEAVADRIRERLIPALADHVFSVTDQAARDAAAGAGRHPFANFFLSARGYARLGFSEQQIAQFLPEPAPGWDVKSCFLDGMREHWNELRDPQPIHWENAYQAEIHALILLADNDEQRLDQTEASLRQALDGIAMIPPSEKGEVLRNADNQGIEHFGFVDGRSQPVFLKEQLEREDSTQTWDPLEPLSVVLVLDRVMNDEDAFGSFYVFRKLEQNVRGFVARENEIADKLDLVGDDRQRVGAMAVGRFRNGTSLATHRAPVAGRPANDFRFNRLRGRCPLHAHIRKVNPRGDLARRIDMDENAVERSRRIVRRGIPYGNRAKPPWDLANLDSLPTKGVGLLFGSFQASIGRQFALLQARWIDLVDFPNARAGSDAVVGVPRAGSENEWNKEWDEDQADRDDRETVALDFGKFVTMLGGEFFFAPSIPFLLRLAPPA